MSEPQGLGEPSIPHWPGELVDLGGYSVLVRTAPSVDAEPALFVHGTRDTFGTIEEMRAALTLIPARTDLAAVEGAGHSLHPDVAALCVQRLSVL